MNPQYEVSLGFSICNEYALLPLVSKEADLANSQAGNSNRDIRTKKMKPDTSSH